MISRHLIVWTFAASLTLVVGGYATVAAAQTQKAASAAAKRLTSAQATKALAEGRTAIKAGRAKAGLDKLGTAINSRRLNYRDLASALYHRGLAYRALKQQAQAIEDLTAALWIKNGLSKDDRAAAIAARAATYEQAGLSGQGQANPGAVPAVTNRVATPAPSTPAAPKPKSVARTPAAPAARPAAPAASPSLGWNTQVASQGRAATPSSGAGASGADPLANLGRNVSGFFNNLFGGQAGSATSPTTASINRPSAAPGTATSGWSSQTSVKRQGSGSTGTAAPKRSASRTAIAVQVAAFRSEGEARQVASQVNKKYAAGLGSSKASVRSAQVGNMGTLHKVIVGPFRSASDTRTVCAQLRRDGLDCLVVK
ncbi:MAG: SPOR domain-containing protein [Pseudomonadota bacterium]